MRPTITEQLTGMARTLRDVVAPGVTDSYASEQLAHVAAGLEHVASRWADVLPDLLTDNRELTDLLRAGSAFHRPSLDLDEPVAPAPPAVDAVLARNEALRGELDQLVRALAAAEPAPPLRDELRAAVRTHLRASVARVS